MRGLGYGTPAAYSSPAYSPFTAAGAQAYGQAVSANAGQAIGTVAAPVVGFTRGLVAGNPVLVGLLIVGLIIYNSQKNA